MSAALTFLPRSATERSRSPPLAYRTSEIWRPWDDVLLSHIMKDLHRLRRLRS